METTQKKPVSKEDALSRAETLGNMIIRRFAAGGGNDALSRATWDELNSDWNQTAKDLLLRRPIYSRAADNVLFNPLLAATIDEMRLGYMKLFAERLAAINAKTQPVVPITKTDPGLAAGYFRKFHEEAAGPYEDTQRELPSLRTLNADYDLTNYTYAWYQRLQRPGLGCSYPDKVTGSGELRPQDREIIQRGMPAEMAKRILGSVIRRSVDSFRHVTSHDFDVSHWSLDKPEQMHPNLSLDYVPEPPVFSSFVEKPIGPLRQFLRNLLQYIREPSVGRG
jgi:hypothetical protein